MAFFLICVRTEDKILDKAVYSRDLSPVKFDKWEMGLALRHDPCTNSAQYFVIHCVPQKVFVPPLEHGSSAESGLYAVEGTGPYSHHQHNNEQGTKYLWKHQSGTSQQRSTSLRTGYTDHETTQSNSLSSYCSCAEMVTGNGCERENCRIKVIPKCSLILLDVEYKIVTRLKANVAGLSFKELSQSKKFREGFVNYVMKNSRVKNMKRNHCKCESVYQTCKLAIALPRLMEVMIDPAPADICFNWSSKLQTLARKREGLEEAMAQLSTLGGGYSSLGDYFRHFSEKAGQLSLAQLKVAMEMEDPVMACRCRLFFALSLMQLGQFEKSQRIIRREYRHALQLVPVDQKLVGMCQGLWSKLKYLMSVRKEQLALPSIQSVKPTFSAQQDSHKLVETNTGESCIQLV